MNPTDEYLNFCLMKAGKFFTNSEFIYKLPFVHDFPKNSCEIVSVFLANAIAVNYGAASIKVARAYSREANEWHFWVEVQNLVIDATAHQFQGYPLSFVCNIPSPLEKRFPDVERMSPKFAFAKLKSIDVELKQEVLNALVSAIA